MGSIFDVWTTDFGEISVINQLLYLILERSWMIGHYPSSRQNQTTCFICTERIMGSKWVAQKIVVWMIHCWYIPLPEGRLTEQISKRELVDDSTVGVIQCVYYRLYMDRISRGRKCVLYFIFLRFPQFMIWEPPLSREYLGEVPHGLHIVGYNIAIYCHKAWQTRSIVFLRWWFI